MGWSFKTENTLEKMRPWKIRAGKANAEPGLAALRAENLVLVGILQRNQRERN